MGQTEYCPDAIDLSIESPTKTKSDKNNINEEELDATSSNSSVMTKKYPETSFKLDAVQVAPGEGQIPTNILSTNSWDIDSFPSLFPSGKYGMHHEREIKLTPQEHICARILNKDTSFAKNNAYVFL